MFDHIRSYIRVELIAYLVLAISFSWVLHSVDQKSIHRGDQAFAAALKAGKDGCVRGQGQVREVNKTHMGIKHSYELLASIADDNIAAINRATRLGLIPDNLEAYYEGVVARQEAVRADWLALAQAVPFLEVASCGEVGKSD